MEILDVIIPPADDSKLTLKGRFTRIEFFRFHSSPLPTLGTGNAVWAPDVDLYETQDELVLEVNLAGVQSDYIHVQFSPNRVQLSGERLDDEHSSTRCYHIMEIERGKFSRLVELPYTIDESSANAEFKEGILTLRMRRKSGGHFTGGRSASREERFK